LKATLRANVARQQRFRKLYSYYPDEGPLRRELYEKHQQFFAAGGTHIPMPTCPEDCTGAPHRDRLALAANRVGKTEGIGGYETALHVTGRYPHWWQGHRFSRGIDAWAAGKRNESTRDIVQQKLFGKVAYRGNPRGGIAKTLDGTGLIPAEDISSVTWKRGIADFVDVVKIHSRFGGYSVLGLKSYEQGRGAFEGTEKDLIWLDEEPPLDVYVECGIRLMTRSGHLLLTFTPMEGMSEVVLEFLPGGALPGAGDV
jgi:phage terminase large subunit-like protein